MKTIHITAIAALIVGSGFVLPAPPPQQTGIKRTDLQRHDLSINGWETLQALVTFEPGSTFPRHRHPGDKCAKQRVNADRLRHECRDQHKRENTRNQATRMNVRSGRLLN